MRKKSIKDKLFRRFNSNRVNFNIVWNICKEVTNYVQNEKREDNDIFCCKTKANISKTQNLCNDLK